MQAADRNDVHQPAQVLSTPDVPGAVHETEQGWIGYEAAMPWMDSIAAFHAIGSAD